MTDQSEATELCKLAEQVLARKDFQTCHQYAMRILQKYPDFARAYYLMAVIASEHRNYAKALDVLNRAIAIDASDADFFVLLAKCELILNHQDKARQAAETALSLNLDNATTLDTLGVTLSRLGEHERAIEIFQKVVLLQPNIAEHHYNLAASQQFTGDFDASEQSYEKAIQLKPDYYRAHSSLSQLTKQTQDSNHLARLEQIYESVAASQSPDARLHIGHALAKECEDLELVAKSFNWLKRGKQAKLESVRYSFSTDKDLFEAADKVLSEYDHSANDTGNGASNSSEPIFIVGMPRTGTTLVERILSSSPEIFAAGELTNFALLLKRRISTKSPFVLDPDTLVEGIKADLSELGDQYVQSTRPRTGHKKYFIDKMPLNFFYAPHILKSLPNAKVICVLRNPMDACLSNYRQLFSTKYPYYNYSYDLENTARYVVEFNRLSEKLAHHLGDNFIRLKYDDLIAEPELKVRGLMDSMGLNFDPEYLNFHEKNTAPVSTASSVQVRKPIYSSSVGRWKKYGELLQPAADVFDTAELEY